MKKEDKVNVIAQIGDVIKEYAHFYLVDVTAMNAAATNAMRAKCYKQEVKMLVVKNTLLKKEFDILKYFLMRPGHTVDKAVLAEAVWGDHIDQSDDFQFVYAQMKNLRRKLSEAGADIEIKSIYGFGYKLLIP